MKRKADLLTEVKNLFANPLLFDAGITDAQEYIHEDLTVGELKNFKTFYQKELIKVLDPIKKLKKQLPAHVWENYKRMGISVKETRTLKKLNQDLFSFWKANHPKVSDRVIEKV